MTQIFIFDKDDNLRLVLEPKTHVSPDKVERPLIYVNGVYVEELNGQETLEFEVPYTENDNDVAWIEGDGRAVIRNQDGDFVEFIIRQVDDTDSHEGLVKRVFCESAEYELNDEYLTGYAPSQPVTLRTALEALLQGTRFEAGEVMASEARNVNIGTMSVKAGITELLTIFGGEKRVRVEVLGNRITRRFIDILSRRGTFTGKRFEFGKDIQQIKREVDYTEIKTALYGFGESTENDGPRVTFADVAWSKANGDPVDKPAGQLWVGDPEALARYGYDGGTRHRFGVYESQASDPGQLLLETWEELQRRSQPTVTYELDVIMLENLAGWDHEQVRLGDGVYVIDRHMRPTTAIEAYVIKIEHDLNDPTKSRVLLGNFRDSFFAESDRLRAIERLVGERRGNWDYKETPQGAQEKADSAFQRAVEEAQRMIDQADLDLSEALERLDEAEQQLQDIQQMIEDLDLTGVLKESEYYNGVRISDELGLEVVRSDGLVRTVLNATQGIAIQTRDSTTDDWLSVFFVNPFNRRLTFDGDILARNITLAGNIVAQNAMITGTLIGSAATLQSVDVRNANIINANIQQATITGTLNGVDGTFVGNIVTSQNAYVGNYLYLGDQSNRTAQKGIRFNTEAFIETNPDPSVRFMIYSAGNCMIYAPGRSNMELYAGGDIILTAEGVVRIASPELTYLYGDNDRVYVNADLYFGFPYSIRDVAIYGARWIGATTVDVSNLVYTDRIAGYSGNLNRIEFGTDGNMILTRTDTYPHYGLVLGQVMVKGLASATQQVQIRNRNDTDYRDLSARDIIANNTIYVSGPNTGYMHFRSTGTYGYLYCPGGNSYIRLASNGEVRIYVDGTSRHVFQTNGGKTGGSYKFEDGAVLGMSPIDSPQAPIEYIIFDVEVTEEGTEIELDERFVEIVDGKYAVFVSATDRPVKVENKQADRFIIKGPAQKVDLRLIGLRRDMADQFWVDMHDDGEEDEMHD